ncbi:MAG TPA: hypothetical protein VMD30_04410, partial [Tepidisphaeraceae bacterium]|nr:hypothetical protein [Tepidisphaeraceae bacterium]
MKIARRILFWWLPAMAMLGCQSHQNVVINVVGPRPDSTDPQNGQQNDNYRAYLSGYLHLSPSQIQVASGEDITNVIIIGVYSAQGRRRIADQIANLNAQFPQLKPMQVEFAGEVQVEAQAIFPGSDWILAVHKGGADSQQEMYEFVAPGETADDWSRMLTCQRTFVGLNYDVQAALQRMRTDQTASNPDLQWNFIQEDDGVGYEMRHPAANGQPAEDQVGRLVYKGGMV